MKNKKPMLLICLIAFMIMSLGVMAETGDCDVNKIISENQRVNELEGQRTREYFDATADVILSNVEKQGWDWLNAMKLYVVEQTKKLVLTFAISIFGAILVINGITGLILLRLQRSKFVLMNEEISRLVKLCEPKKEMNDDENKKEKEENDSSDDKMNNAMEKICDMVILKMDAQNKSLNQLKEPMINVGEIKDNLGDSQNKPDKFKDEIIPTELISPKPPEQKKSRFNFFSRNKKPRVDE